MSQIGRMNTLYVLREVDFGVYLDGEELGDILLPIREVPKGTKVDDTLEVFVYFDSKDIIVASTKRPKAQVDEFAFLSVIDTNETGAFLDWGLPKDLLVPFREQSYKLIRGRQVVVRVYHDRASNRIAASTKLDKFLSTEKPSYQPDDKVDLFIVARTDLGYKAIVDGEFWGLLYEDQVFSPLVQGQKLKGYIKAVRADGKIDLSLHEGGKIHVDAATHMILEALKEGRGFLPFTDKTPPDVIYQKFGLSKKVFKRSLGSLYKKRLITLEPAGIRLVSDKK